MQSLKAGAGACPITTGASTAASDPSNATATAPHANASGVPRLSRCHTRPVLDTVLHGVARATQAARSMAQCADTSRPTDAAVPNTSLTRAPPQRPEGDTSSCTAPSAAVAHAVKCVAITARVSRRPGAARCAAAHTGTATAKQTHGSATRSTSTAPTAILRTALRPALPAYQMRRPSYKVPCSVEWIQADLDPDLVASLSSRAFINSASLWRRHCRWNTAPSFNLSHVSA